MVIIRFRVKVRVSVKFSVRISVFGWSLGFRINIENYG